MTIPSWQAILAVAGRFEPTFERDILDALAFLQDDVEVARIASAVAQGRIATAALLLTDDHIARDLAPAIETAHKAFAAAGAASASHLVNAGASTVLRFDVTNELAVGAARSLAASLVTRVGQETRDAIRSIITRAFTEGRTAADTARLIRPLIGLNMRQSQAVTTYRDSLTASGLRADKVDRAVTRYSAKLLRERASMIARTEIMTASNAGQHALWQQAVAAGQLAPTMLRKWVDTPGERTCPRCKAMHGVRVGLDQPFQTDDGPILYPPLHPRCRCVAILVRP